MHEFSICRNLIDIVLREAGRLPRPIGSPARVLVAVGALRQIVPETLVFAYQEMTKNTLLEGSLLDIRTIPITLDCQDCQARQEVPGPPFVCAACGSTRLELRTGMELFVENLEVEEPEHVEH